MPYSAFLLLLSFLILQYFHSAPFPPTTYNFVSIFLTCILLLFCPFHALFSLLQVLFFTFLYPVFLYPASSLFFLPCPPLLFVFSLLPCFLLFFPCQHSPLTPLFLSSQYLVSAFSIFTSFYLIFSFLIFNTVFFYFMFLHRLSLHSPFLLDASSPVTHRLPRTMCASRPITLEILEVERMEQDEITHNKQDKEDLLTITSLEEEFKRMTAEPNLFVLYENRE